MYVIVWEFQVKPGRETEFEHAYGPDGEWARFFQQGDGYLGTELHCEVDGKVRYLTIDRWTSETAHQAFRARWGAEYKALDRRCESLTDREVHLGSFRTVAGYTKKEV